MTEENRPHEDRPLWPELPSRDASNRLLSPIRPEEKILTDAVHDLAISEGETALASRISQNLVALRAVAESASAYPSPLYTQTLGQRHRNIQTLVERLTRQNTFSIELVIPTRGIMGHAFCMARLNFFRMLRHCLAELLDVDSDREEVLKLIRRSDDFVTDCVATRATEEILKSILCRDTESQTIRERAGFLLLRLWHNASSHRLGDLVPVLSATWHARRKARVHLGTLMGASEMVELLVAGADSRFLDFLTRETTTEEEAMALREFLFGLSHEELTRLGQRVGEKMVSLSDLEEYDIRGVDSSSVFKAGDEAERLFLFFMKRHLMATHREELGMPGPWQTAEEYVLTHLLATEWEHMGLDEHSTEG